MNRKYHKEDIIATGIELFRKNGYNNTGINDILKGCGIPKGSFYNFFDTKEDFGKNVLEQYGEAALVGMQQMLSNSTQTPLTRLRNFYQMILEKNEMDGCDSGCLVNNFSAEVAGINPVLGEVANDQFQKWVNTLTACIKEGQEQGEIIEDYSAEELATYLHQNCFGALNRMKLTRDDSPLRLCFKMTFDFLEKK